MRAFALNFLSWSMYILSTIIKQNKAILKLEKKNKIIKGASNWWNQNKHNFKG